MKSTITCILLVAANAQPWRELRNFRGSASEHRRLNFRSAYGLMGDGDRHGDDQFVRIRRLNVRSGGGNLRRSLRLRSAPRKLEESVRSSVWDADDSTAGSSSNNLWSSVWDVDTVPTRASVQKNSTPAWSDVGASSFGAGDCVEEIYKDKCEPCMCDGGTHWCNTAVTPDGTGSNGCQPRKGGGELCGQNWECKNFDCAYPGPRHCTGPVPTPAPPTPVPTPAPPTSAPAPKPLPEYRGKWQWLNQGSGEQTWSATASWETATDTATTDLFTYGLSQTATASTGVNFFGVGVEIEVAVGASQEWSTSVEHTISQVRGGAETAQCGSPMCTGGNLYRWTVLRLVGGVPTQELGTCSFVCIRNSLNRLAKPKCPVAWCGQVPDPDSASGTGDCQCCNGIEWAADTTDQDARKLTCPGATDPNGAPYPWMPPSAAAASPSAAAPHARGATSLWFQSALEMPESVLLNGATCYNCS